MSALLLWLASAAQTATAGSTLADCTFRPIVPDKREAERSAIPFAILFESPAGEQPYIRSARVHDPRKMLEGLPIMGGFYAKDGKMLLFVTDDSRPIHFKIAFSPGKGEGTWAGAIGMNGAGTAKEHLARSYMGNCTIGASADAAARFEALEAAR